MASFFSSIMNRLSVLCVPHHSIVLVCVAQALHAVVCVRTDRRDEALALCRRVADQRPPPTDDAVLSTLAHVYRAADARTFQFRLGSVWQCFAVCVGLGMSVYVCEIWVC